MQWMVRENRDLWRDFPSQLSDETEIAYQHNPRDRDVFYSWPPQNTSGTPYTIDFVDMKQTNLRTQFKRDIRRVIVSEFLPMPVHGPVGVAPTGDTGITGPSSVPDPSAADADDDVIVVDADVDGYEQPGE